MFRRGGPANDGIMSGIEDREQLAKGLALGAVAAVGDNCMAPAPGVI